MRIRLCDGRSARYDCRSEELALNLLAQRRTWQTDAGLLSYQCGRVELLVLTDYAGG